MPGRMSMPAAAALGLALAAIPIEAASAQHALGGGGALNRDLRAPQQHKQQVGALDANIQIGADRYNPAAPKTDFYSRNLIVTGDVAGGRGFRGNVGYREQSEFTAPTGADANRQWYAYSVFSSPMAIRAGIDPFQASQEYGAMLYTRDYSNAAARDILTSQQPLDSRLAFDRFTAAGMKMARQADIIDAANVRDTSSRIDWRLEGKLPGSGSSSGAGAAGPAQLGGGMDGASVDAMLSRLGLSTYERQRLKQDVLAGRTNRDLVGQVYDPNAVLQAESLGDTLRVQPALPNEYVSVIDALRARAGMAPGSLQGTGSDRPEEGATAGSSLSSRSLGTQMAWMRSQLERSGPDLAPARLAAQDTLRFPSPPPVDEPAQGDEAPKGTDAQGGEGPRQPTLEELAALLKHNQRMESLVPESAGYIHDMMDLAAQAMRRGDYFRAEDRYSSVLRVIPGHPLALAGVANADLGAGILRSAALTLRKFLTTHPEMIGTRFGAEVLPEAQRMDVALETARARLRAASAPDAGPNLAADRYDYGLLIAYIGFQQDKPEVVREGLDAMRAASADDPLVKVLDHVWLSDGQAPAGRVPVIPPIMPEPVQPQAPLTPPVEPPPAARPAEAPDQPAR